MKVFIAGARAVLTLDEPVQERLRNIYAKNYSVIIGDASGIDSAVQMFFSAINYRNVVVYASEGKARNNTGNWDVHAVDVPGRSRGFDYYAAKDMAMANDADYGFMIWNGESKGTLYNIINLLNQDKKSIVYLTTTKNFHNIEGIDDLQELVNSCGQTAKNLLKKIVESSVMSKFQQTSLF